MPPVCSYSTRRRWLSSTPDRRGAHSRRRGGGRERRAKLVRTEPPRHARQVPDRLDRRLCCDDGAVRHQELCVGREPADRDRLLDLWEVEVAPRHRDGRPHVQLAGRHPLGEDLLRKVPPRVERDNRARLRPRGVRPDLTRRQRVGEVRTEAGGRGVCGQRDRAVHRVRAAVRADGIAAPGVRNGGDHRPSLVRVGFCPADRLRLDVELRRVGGQLDDVARARVERHLEGPRGPGGQETWMDAGQQRPIETGGRIVEEEFDSDALWLRYDVVVGKS